MAQVIFGPDASCANGDLDANFGELYGKQAWATTGIGYATGAGGGVTQSTNKATTVVLDKMCGQITMNAASLAAGASIAFVLQNSMIAATDCVVVNRGNGSGTEKAYRVHVDRVLTGNAVIIVENFSAGALAEALVLNFAVIKAVAS